MTMKNGIDKNKEYIISEHKNGRVSRDLSQEFGCAPNTIRRRLKK